MQEHILIVDDEQPITEVLSTVLQNEGFNVDTAANGREGLDQVERKNYDLVLLDIMMPVIDGIEMLRRMRADEASVDIPVILMSAGAQTLQDVGASYAAFLAKPFNLPQLLGTIKDVLRAREHPDS